MLILIKISFGGPVAIQNFQTMEACNRAEPIVAKVYNDFAGYEYTKTKCVHLEDK